VASSTFHSCEDEEEEEEFAFIKTLRQVQFEDDEVMAAQRADTVVVPRSRSQVLARPQVVNEQQRAELLQAVSMTRGTFMRVKGVCRDALLALGVKMESDAAAVRLRELSAWLLESLGIDESIDDVAEWSVDRCVIFLSNVVDGDQVVAGDAGGIWSTERIREYFIRVAEPGEQRRGVSVAVGLNDEGGGGDDSFCDAGAKKSKVRILAQSRTQNPKQRVSRSALPQGAAASASLAPTQLQFSSDSDDSETVTATYTDPMADIDSQVEKERNGRSQRASPSHGRLDAAKALDPDCWPAIVTDAFAANVMAAWHERYFAKALAEGRNNDQFVVADCLKMIRGLLDHLAIGGQWSEHLAYAARTALKRIIVIQKVREGASTSFVREFAAVVDSTADPQWMKDAEREGARRAKLANETRERAKTGVDKDKKKKKVPKPPGKPAVN
jgi:hypothetical protein